ncbi:protein THYLAKOID ASSEMBLY 8-like, chloroplastic isoform X2 [Magnolia sinica]|uniref:protein THYLAKOID ASSEMBLY 8-like, chloroplastic isoform X2 n=1 Tax=Magnolia sinica TaxID=86752 RepID=UPI002659C0C5|nr:protein THYLAKOID ASSEMBLY 8-like, chloroplastic isoform X2 [Magnolia sinica]
MGSLQFRFSEVGFSPNPGISTFFPFPKTPSLSPPIPIPTSVISCGLRNGPRKPIWRGRVMSTEAIQAVQSLKLAKSASKLEEVLDRRISRLLKADLMAALVELQRQNELEIALQKEVWYKPDLSLYCNMIFMLGKNKLIGIAEELFSELKKEGLKPDTRTYTEMMGAFLQVGMVEKAMETYTLMKESGCSPDKLTLTILIRNLEKAGEDELVSSVKKDCADYMDFPERFLDEVKQKHVKRKLKSYELV